MNRAAADTRWPKRIAEVGQQSRLVSITRAFLQDEFCVNLPQVEASLQRGFFEMRRQQLDGQQSQ